MAAIQSSSYPVTLQLGRVRLHAGGRRTLNRPRILLADDHPAMLVAESALLSPFFEVVGTAVDGAALVSEARKLVLTSL